MKSADEIDNPGWSLLQRIPVPANYITWSDHGEEVFPHSETVPDDFRDHPALSSSTFRVSDGRYVFWRSWFTSVFAWAIPSPKALDFIAETLDGRPLVEIGAGNGYWAWCLAQMGVDVVAYDRSPFGSPRSWFGGERFIERQMSWADQQREFFPVQEGGPKVLRDHGDRVLFMCWPPYQGSMAAEALKAYGGDTCIFIGEWDGGCNADEEFWSMVRDGRTDDIWDDEADEYVSTDAQIAPQSWRLETHQPIPKFEGLHDDIYVFKRLTDA